MVETSEEEVELLTVRGTPQACIHAKPPIHHVFTLTASSICLYYLTHVPNKLQGK